MATTVKLNGSNYSIPAYGDSGWAQGAGNLSSYLIALASVTAIAYSQTFTNQTSVTVTHNLGHYPIVQVLDASGNLIQPDVTQHTSVNAFTVSFNPALTGTIIWVG